MTDLVLEPDQAGDDPPHRRVAPYIALALALVLGTFTWILATGKSHSGDTADSRLIGQAAPAVAGRTLDGGSYALDADRGKWVVVNFFAPWCGPCRDEHPELLRFSETRRDVRLVSVFNAVDAVDTKKWFATNGGTWPVVQDDGARIQVSFGVAKVPETWIIDPNGVVVARIVLQVTADGLSQIVDRLAGAS